VIDVSDFATTFVAATPPNETAVAPVNPVPVIVTGVPPANGPDDGDTDDTEVPLDPPTTIDPMTGVVEPSSFSSDPSAFDACKVQEYVPGLTAVPPVLVPSQLAAASPSAILTASHVSVLTVVEACEITTLQLVSAADVTKSAFQLSGPPSYFAGACGSPRNQG
jgi:hypothetical protein